MIGKQFLKYVHSLKAINSLQFKNTEELHPDLKGGCNTVAFAEMCLPKSIIQQIYPNNDEKDRKQKDNSQIKTIKVAQRENKDTSKTRGYIAANKLILDKSINSPFIQKVLYYGKTGDHTVINITPRASCDLFTFVENNRDKLSIESLKKLIAQVILGLSALHQNGLIHCDIKTENIFVSEENGELHLEIADLDTITEVDVNGRLKNRSNIFGCTPYYASPEVKELFNTYFNRSKIRKLNSKAIDCYALGNVLETMALLTKNKDTDLTNLILSLKEQDPEQRYTISQVMTHPFFGENPQELFDNINEQHKKDFYIDHYRLQALRPNDDFMLLPDGEYVKSIYDEAEKLGKQLRSFEKGKFQWDNDTATAMIFAIERRAIELKKMFTQIPEDVSDRTTIWINKLKDYIDLRVSPFIDVNYMYIYTNRFYKIEIPQRKHDSNKKCDDSKNQIVTTSQDKIADRCANILKNAVDASVAEYIKVNKLDISKCCCVRLFSKHGPKGKALALALQSKIGDAFINGKDAKEILKMCNTHLNTAGGNWGKTSFKTILSDKLALYWRGMPEDRLVDRTTIRSRDR